MGFLDLLANRGLGLLHLESRLLLGLPDLHLGPFLLQAGGGLRLGDELVCGLSGFVLVDIEEHTQPVSIVVSAVDQVHVCPALRAVRLFHLEHADIGVLGDHFQMGLGHPLSGDTGHFQTVKRILGHFIRKACHTEPKPLGELAAHVDGAPVAGLTGNGADPTRYFAQDIRRRGDALLHLRMDLVKTGRLLEDAVVDGVLAFLVGRRTDHAVLEAVSVPSIEGQVDGQMSVGPLDLLELVHDLVAFLVRDHEKGISLHLLLELVLFIMKLLPEILIIKQGPGTLFLHIGKNQHAAGEILCELPDLLHPALSLSLGHMDERDLEVLPALADSHAAAKIDGLLLLLGHEIDLVRHRRNVRGAR